jgi:hypothetical protein
MTMYPGSCKLWKIAEDRMLIACASWRTCSQHHTVPHRMTITIPALKEAADYTQHFFSKSLAVSYNSFINT